MTEAPSRTRTFLQRHLAWVLWLALLLPLAQGAAFCHALSHVGAASKDDGQRALHTSSTHCDLCLAAAAVIDGVLPGTPQRLPHVAVHHELPSALVKHAFVAAPIWGYLSRAPPFAVH